MRTILYMATAIVIVALVTQAASAGTVTMDSFSSPGPVAPDYASSNAYSGYLDNTMSALSGDATPPVGSGREIYERPAEITPPDIMMTTKFEAFGNEVYVSGEHGKTPYFNFVAKTNDGENGIALDDIAYERTVDGNAFGLNSSGDFAGSAYGEAYVGIKATDNGDKVLNDGEPGNTLVKEIRGQGIAPILDLEDVLEKPSGTEKEQWEALWQEINTTLNNDDHNGSVELTTDYEIKDPGEGLTTIGSTSETVTLNSSPPDVNAVPAPSSLISGLVLFGVIGGSSWLRRPHRDRN